MQDDVIGRMRDSLTEDFRDMGLPEKDIASRVQNLIREVNGIVCASDSFGDPRSETDSFNP